MNSKQTVQTEGKTVLVTGSCGFIGASLVIKLLESRKAGRIVSLDNMNDYYDPALKQYRLEQVAAAAERTGTEHVFIRGDLTDRQQLEALFAQYRPSVAVNLAAQAGVRYSVDHPDTYIASNIVGFFNLLECCRHYPVEHLVYASSSSVYGNSANVPFRTTDKTDEPVSLYAATKKSGELLAHSYAKLYDIPCTGLRFFTVYGPAGRPDMFYYSAAEKLLQGGTIRLFNYGNCKRDFTYIDDITDGILAVMQKAPARQTGPDGLPVPPFAVYNIGCGSPVNLADFIRILQEELVSASLLPADYDFPAHEEPLPMQPGDVAETFADTTPLEADFGCRPKTGLRTGLRAFVQWYKAYRKMKEYCHE